LAAIPPNPNHFESKGPATQWGDLAERIVVCARLLRDDLGQRAGRWDLSEPEFSVLWICRETPPEGIGQNELADSLAISASAVSGLVERLRRRGLLEGRRGQSDRRRQLWRLTPAGRNQLYQVLADWTGRLRAEFSAVALDELLAGLNQLDDTIRGRAGSRRPGRRLREKPDFRTASGSKATSEAKREGAV